MHIQSFGEEDEGSAVGTGIDGAALGVWADPLDKPASGYLGGTNVHGSCTPSVNKCVLRLRLTQR